MKYLLTTFLLLAGGSGIAWESGGRIANNIFKWMDEELEKLAVENSKWT